MWKTSEMLQGTRSTYVCYRIWDKFHNIQNKTLGHHKSMFVSQKKKNIKFYHATETLDYGDQKLFVPLPINLRNTQTASDFNLGNLLNSLQVT